MLLPIKKKTLKKTSDENDKKCPPPNRVNLNVQIFICCKSACIQISKAASAVKQASWNQGGVQVLPVSIPYFSFVRFTNGYSTVGIIAMKNNYN